MKVVMASPMIFSTKPEPVHSANRTGYLGPDHDDLRERLPLFMQRSVNVDHRYLPQGSLILVFLAPLDVFCLSHEATQIPWKTIRCHLLPYCSFSGHSSCASDAAGLFSLGQVSVTVTWWAHGQAEIRGRSNTFEARLGRDRQRVCKARSYAAPRARLRSD